MGHFGGVRHPKNFVGEVECVLEQGGGALQDARGCLVALGRQQAPGLCSRLSIRYVDRLWGFIWSECPSKKLKEGGKGPKWHYID